MSMTAHAIIKFVESFTLRHSPGVVFVVIFYGRRLRVFRTWRELAHLQRSFRVAHRLLSKRALFLLAAAEERQREREEKGAIHFFAASCPDSILGMLYSARI